MKRSVADPPAGVQRWGLRLCVGMMMLLHGVAAKVLAQGLCEFERRQL